MNVSLSVNVGIMITLEINFEYKFFRFFGVETNHMARERNQMVVDEMWPSGDDSRLLSISNV